MKPKEFQGAIDGLASSFEAAGASASAEVLVRLSKVFGASSKSSVVATLKALSDVTGGEQASVGSSTVLELVNILNSLRPFANLVAKAGFTKDLNAVASWLKKFTDRDVQGFSDSCVDKLETLVKEGGTGGSGGAGLGMVNKYAVELEGCLGQDDFVALYERLKCDSSLKAADIVAIGKAFTGRKHKSKAAALKAIWDRHHTLLLFRAKAASRDGRSAA